MLGKLLGEKMSLIKIQHFYSIKKPEKVHIKNKNKKGGIIFDFPNILKVKNKQKNECFLKINNY